MEKQSLYTYLNKMGFTNEEIASSLEECDKYYKPLEHVNSKLFDAVCSYAARHNEDISEILSFM